MTVRRGDIILANLPFTDGRGSKVRPALVVQSDHNHQRLDDVILAMITSTNQRAAVESTQLLLDIATVVGQQSGLLHNSTINTHPNLNPRD
jgi:mRNA-degrading endonuclease toxin of MazEF toxin-antitoxin module